MKFCNPIRVRRKSSWTTHLSPFLPPFLHKSSPSSPIKQLSPIARYMNMYKANLGSKEGRLQGPLLKRRTISKSCWTDSDLGLHCFHIRRKETVFPWLYPNISLRPAALGKPHTPFVFTEPRQLYAEKVGVPMRDEVLTEGTLTQSSTKPHAALLLPTLRTAELTTYQCLWFPTRPLGILPPQWSRAPLESPLSPAPRTARRTRVRAHTLAHAPTHTPALLHRPWREMRREPWGPDGGGCNTLPRQQPLALLPLHPLQHRDVRQEDKPLPRQQPLKAPLPRLSHSTPTLSGRPARC